MAEGTNLRARRLLAILHLFEPDTEIPLATIASALDTTAEQIARDLDLLAMCGVSADANDLVPIFVEDGCVVVYNPLPALDRAVRLSGSEAHALIAALQAAGFDADAPLVATLLDAAGGDDIRAADVERVVRAAAAPAQAEALKAAALALERHLVLDIGYQSGGSDAPTKRFVEPMSLVNERGAWYLEAWCRKAGALRTFRIDRIVSADPTTETFTPRELSVTGRAFIASNLPVATVRLAAGEDFSEREWPGVALLAENPDGSLDVSVPYAGTGWIARQVLARLGGAEVLSPPEVRAAVAELAAASR